MDLVIVSSTASVVISSAIPVVVSFAGPVIVPAATPVVVPPGGDTIFHTVMITASSPMLLHGNSYIVIAPAPTSSATTASASSASMGPVVTIVLSHSGVVIPITMPVP
ncbi:MAG: hypothetical protein ACE5GK_00600 [Nitrospiria bacterium]